MYGVVECGVRATLYGSFVSRYFMGNYVSLFMVSTNIEGYSEITNKLNLA